MARASGIVTGRNLRPPPLRSAAVTGASGFLASELVAQLLQRDYKVKATVRSLARAEHLTKLPSAGRGNLTLLEADLLDDGAFDEAVAGAEVVFHTASPFVTSGVTDPEATLFTPALKGTRNLFGSVVRAVNGGANPKPRIVLTSSVGAIIGNAADKAEPFTEDDWNFSSTPEGNPLGDGIDIYRYSKLLAEREAWALAEKHDLPLSAICPSFIMGPPRTSRLDSESLSNMRLALEGELPHRGDTPMIDVRDCAAIHIAAAETPEAAGKRFVASTPRALTRARLLQILRGRYPEFQIVDAGEPADPKGLREMLRSTTLPLLGAAGELRTQEATVLDMAAAMLLHGVVKPQETIHPASREAHERDGIVCSRVRPW